MTRRASLLSTAASCDKAQAFITSKHRAFTLIEVLVAVGIFLFLGFGATAFLVQGLKTWRTCEWRRDAFQRAEFIFSHLKADLSCIYTNSRRCPKKIFLLSDYDPEGRQRIFFSRSVPPPEADERISLSGNTLLGSESLDGQNDLAELRSGRLGPPGAVMTVCYFVGEEEKLYRSFRTPGVEVEKVKGDWFKKGAQLVAEGVMHIEFNFWGPESSDWRKPPSEGGPLYEWKWILKDKERKRALLGVFPSMIEVKVVLAAPGISRQAVLTQDVSPRQDEIAVLPENNLPEGEENFLKIGKEWISYKRLSSRGDRLIGVKRGRRNTRPAAHKAGEVARMGITFRRVFKLPLSLGRWVR